VYAGTGTLALLIWNWQLSASNRVIDAAADHSIYPDRSTLLQVIRPDTLGHAVTTVRFIYLSIAVLAWALGVLAWYIAAGLTVMLLLSFTYSGGPQIKSTRFAGPTAIGVAPAMMYGLGVFGEDPHMRVSPAATHALASMIHAVPLALFGLSVAMCASKDLLKSPADLSYHSMYHTLVESNQGFVRAVALLTSPFIVILGLLAGGVVPLRFLLLVSIWPVAVCFARCLTKANRSSEKRTARKIGNIYWHCATGLILGLTFPRLTVAIIVLGGFLVHALLAQYFTD
jgi:hypothetical protein